MKFLCDVHISVKVVKFIKSRGYECLHVKNILDGTRTKDKEICKFADAYDYIVITKDSDFRNSFFVLNSPLKLIKINLGNISNNELIDIINANLDKFKIYFTEKSKIIEINKNSIVVF